MAGLYILIASLALIGISHRATESIAKSIGIRISENTHILTNIFTANMISSVRIPQGILTIYLFETGYREIATLHFVFWAYSDALDGIVARTRSDVTEMGKWLDPLSDKLFYLPMLYYFAFKEYIPFYAAHIIFLLDCCNQGSRFILKQFGLNMAANIFGKLKTFYIMTACSLLILIEFYNWHFIEIKDAFIYIMIALSVCSIVMKIENKYYASMVTGMNAIAGIAAIISFYNGRFIEGTLYMCLGCAFDVMDGWLARKWPRKGKHLITSGEFHDDVADFISFGLAPAYLILNITHSTLIGILIALLYVVAVFYRLHRFITKDKLNQKPGVFNGLPSPAGAAATIFSCVILALTQTTIAQYISVPIVEWSTILIACTCAGLMASPVQFIDYRVRHEFLEKNILIGWIIICITTVTLIIKDIDIKLILLSIGMIASLSYIALGWSTKEKLRQEHRVHY